MAKEREKFGSRMAVIFAMAGSAIGLGNIWRFPYMVGEHGGAAFVLVYIIATLLISLPVFIAEVTLGRRSRLSSYGAMSSIRPGKKTWKFAGALSIIIPLIIVSYYSVIGGWSVSYLVRAAVGEFVRSAPEATSAAFDSYITSAWMPLLAHLFFLGICALVVLGGVRSGIEKFSKITIPVLFVLIVVMTVYSVTLPGASAGVKYLVKPDFSQLNAQSLAYAVGQSFYSLSLGMGAIITYGSYVDKKENIVVSSAGTALSDLLFAIIAGFAIMPAVFAAGIEPGAGPGLVFQSIPFIFSSLGASYPILSFIVSVVFFITIVVAAMTSCISLLEVGVSFLMERFGIPRGKGCALLFVVCGAVGAVCSLSFGPLNQLQIGGKCIFDMFDWFSSNILLLVMAFLTVIFVGFIMDKQEVRDEITNGGRLKANGRLFPLIHFLIKWVAPVMILAIFVTNFIF